MPSALFIATGFEGVTHITAEPSPLGVTLDDALGDAIEAHLGTDALDTFQSQGGQNHRDPHEIVSSLTDPDIEWATLSELTRRVVNSQLKIIEPEVGKPLADGALWPRLVPGFAEYWHGLSTLRERGKQIGTAVLSDTHTGFQQRAFEVHGLALPDLFMNPDVLDALHPNVPREELVSPAPFLFETARQIWLMRQRSLGRPVLNLESFLIHPDSQLGANMAADWSDHYIRVEPLDASSSWTLARQFLKPAPVQEYKTS